MKTCSCLVVLWTTLAMHAWCQDAATDQKQLEGKWLPTSGELAGKPFPEDRLKATSLVIKGDTYTVTVGDVVDKGTTKRDASKDAENHGHRRHRRPQQGQDHPRHL